MKLNNKTLITEEIKLYIRCEVITAVTKTPRIYTVIMLASLKPSQEKRKPIAVDTARINALFSISIGFNFSFCEALFRNV